MKEVPIWEKSNLTLDEAAAYSGIGKNKLRELSDERTQLQFCPVEWEQAPDQAARARQVYR